MKQRTFYISDNKFPRPINTFYDVEFTEFNVLLLQTHSSHEGVTSADIKRHMGAVGKNSFLDAISLMRDGYSIIIKWK